VVGYPASGWAKQPFRIVVIVAGELDLATAPLLVREVTGELSNPVTSLAIDLGAVTFLDSSGLEAVLTVRREAQEHGLPFMLVSVSRVVCST
jgi:anti-sigma B factor antagonist